MTNAGIRKRVLANASRITLCVMVLLALNGCALRMGNKIVAGDRFDYSGAIARSWKEQMLLNMVKLRYSEPPVFLDVAQVVASYTFEASGSISAPDWQGAPAGAAGGISGRWAESPTITFNPMTGEKFIKSLMQPVSPVSLLSLVEAGWPIDNVFAFGVRSLNGLRAASRVALLAHSGEEDFYRMLVLLRELQISGAVALRIEQKEGEQAGVFVFQSRPMDESLAAKSKEVRKLLRLSPDANNFKIVFGAEPKDDTELAFLTRSMLEMLGEAAMGVEVPATDVSEGRAVPVPPSVAAAEATPLFRLRVQSAKEKPGGNEAFAAIHYRGSWFWVSDRDLPSKRGLAFLMILFALAESGTTASPPVLTISKP
jgi:hypothetical protein